MLPIACRRRFSRRCGMETPSRSSIGARFCTGSRPPGHWIACGSDTTCRPIVSRFRWIGQVFRIFVPIRSGWRKAQNYCKDCSKRWWNCPGNRPRHFACVIWRNWNTARSPRLWKSIRIRWGRCCIERERVCGRCFPISWPQKNDGGPDHDREKTRLVFRHRGSRHGRTPVVAGSAGTAARVAQCLASSSERKHRGGAMHSRSIRAGRDHSSHVSYPFPSNWRWIMRSPVSRVAAATVFVLAIAGVALWFHARRRHVSLRRRRRTVPQV